MAIYDGVCVKAGLDASLGVNWIDRRSFEMKVTRIEESTQLSFSCTVAMYPNEDALPNELDNCVATGRKRRQASKEHYSASISVSLPIRSAASISLINNPNGAASAILQLGVLMFILI